ncbi:AraC family transcriptional regulator [Azoarcus olearius]|uniref:AraC-family transcriptional regulator n=1 Tax=Azoarcus sp. (strain BH72) TaxID=418699 RepID=A1K6U8_AZOSB|nr:AraC family transcriptional regulator [Azoarcus olearius]CAL94553.1 putative AraC-family transcriptional regulator [Azoarcus olearius]
MNAPDAGLAEPLAAYPFFRSSDAEESRQHVARVFCPHELRQVTGRRPFASRHNMLRLHETALNYLTYGTDVDILPGRLESFYLVQMPLAGGADIRCGEQAVLSSPRLATILSPDDETRMRWQHDARQLLLWIPREALERRLEEHLGERPDRPLSFHLGLPQDEGLTRSWCRMLADLAANIDQCGADWLRFRPTVAALEDCLLRGLLQLHQHNYSDCLNAPRDTGKPRHVQRAMDYVQAHIEEGISVGDIARAACVSVRALEEGFRKYCDTTPLAYLRELRLERARKALLALPGRSESVTDVAHRYGFVHLGRFSAYYKARFGETPSQTVGRARRC